MKKIIKFFVLASMLNCVQANAQDFSTYLLEGQDFLSKTLYMEALESYDNALEFA